MCKFAHLPSFAHLYLPQQLNPNQSLTHPRSYTSVIHRVKCPPAGKHRYSFPCNFNGNPDFIIKCLEKCRKKASDEKYPPVTVENFIRPQYADTYGRGGVYETKRTGNAVAA
jgi:isopenicillin N synthase-like dioxygenase